MKTDSDIDLRKQLPLNRGRDSLSPGGAEAARPVNAPCASLGTG